MIIKYFAEDGTEFDNEEECILYEKTSKLGNGFSDPRTKIFFFEGDKCNEFDFEEIKENGFENVDAFCVYSEEDMDKMSLIADIFGDVLPWNKYEYQKNKFFGRWSYDYYYGKWVLYEELTEMFDTLKIFSNMPGLPNFKKIFQDSIN